MTERSSNLWPLGACPDPALIAAHAERRLTGEEAARMDEHVAGCAECYEVFSETLQFALAEGETPGVSPAGAPATARTAVQGRRMFAITGLATAALVVIGTAGWLYRSRATAPLGSSVAELAEAMGTRRFVEPRVTGGFRHGRLVTLRSGDRPQGLDAQPPAVLQAVARIREQAEGDTSPEALAALGVTYLVSGDATAAVKALESAVAQRPGDARLRSDLAAAYLVRAEHAGEPADIPQALESAERAIAEHDAPVEAWFNRALALERLHQVDAARKAWEDYLQRDAASGWADEARQHLAALPRQPRSSLEQDRARARAALREGPAAVEALAKESAALLREYWANELLPAWSEAVLSARDDAEAHRERIALAGDALSRATADALPAETARALSEPVAATSPDPWRAQAVGFRAFQDAQHRLRAEEPSCDAFKAAERGLREGGSPYARWAKQQVVNTCLLTSNHTAAATELDALKSGAIAGRHLELEGRAHWLRGLLHAFRGELTDALVEYDAATGCFQRIGDRENVAFLLMLRTECIQLMGDLRGAWRDRERALGLMGDVRNPARRHGMLGEVTLACVDAGLPRSALHFADAAVEAARAWSQPGAISDALVIRAGVHHALDANERAEADLIASRQATAAITEPEAAAEQAAESDATAGLILLGRDPEEAMRSLRRALDHFGAVAPVRLPALHHLLARVHTARGSAEEAEAELTAGIEAMERGRIPLRDAALQVSFFDQSLPLFEDMVRLQIATHRDPERALGYVERGRARQLGDSLAGATVSPLDSSQLRSGLASGVTLVYSLSLDDRLLAWAVSREGTRFIERPLAAAELARLVTAYRAAVERRAPADALRRVSARLHDELVRPFIPFIASQRALVFIPDELLQSVPFAGLWNDRTGRYLVEDYAVSVVPSGTVFIRASAAASRPRGARVRALAIGNPSVDRRLWRNLPDLPGAEAEAAEVAALYAEAELLQGAAATKPAFLDRLRGSDVVHYAGHAVSTDDSPSTTRLLLAPGPRRGDSGALYVHELGRSSLPRTRVVVLAACRTGGGAVSRVEGALSLGRPFLAAGVPDVVASLWDIEDSLSRPFFVAFHRALLAQDDPVAALRTTQLHYLRGPDPALAHPASWAPFICMGGLDLHSSSKGEAS
jgi:CHAT domain-containing protein/tetratricopeptide (TPR) repeat protein